MSLINTHNYHYFIIKVNIAAEKLGLKDECKNNALILCEVKSNGGKLVISLITII